MVPKGPEMGAAKQPKSPTSAKIRHQSAPKVKACKKTVSRRGQTPEIDDGCTLFTHFTEAKASQNGAKMTPKLSLKAPKIEFTRNEEGLLARAGKSHEQAAEKFKEYLQT